MPGQIIVSVLGGIAFAVAAVACYFHFRHRKEWAPGLVRLAAGVALLVDVVYLARVVTRIGMLEALNYNFSDAVLISMLVGVMALGTHLSGSLRGLDGFLFIVAAVLSFAEIAVMRQPPVDATERPWFISHALAFALSATAFVAGGAAGVAYLLVNRMLRRKRPTKLVGSVAPLESLERFGRWMPVIGFPLFTYGILTGLCGIAHRKDLTQSAWYLDPTFSLSLLAWAIYAYLSYGSLRRPKLRGRRFAVLSTYGLGLIVVVFFAREFLSPVHQ